MIRLAFMVVSLCIATRLLAQENVNVTARAENKDSVRDIYIKRFSDYFFVYPVIKQRSLNFALEKTDRSNTLTYKPNTSYSFGVGLYIFEVGIELAFAVPLDEKSKAIYGNSDARDLQLNFLGKKWGFDAFYQKYSGFYITDSEQASVAGFPYPQRPDIESENFGLTGHYIFNSQKFSFRSAYNFAERQLSGRGSFLLSSSINTFKVSGNASIINDQQRVVFGDKVAFRKLRYTTFSIAPGYTYNLVLKNFFLNGSLSIGPAHHWIYYTTDNGDNQYEIEINTFVAARIGIGYNGDRLFGGITFVTQGSSVKFQDVEFSNNSGSFKVLMGYRFPEKGLLKKKICDFLPFKI